MDDIQKKIDNFIQFHDSCLMNPLKTIRNGFEDKGVDKNIYVSGLLICCGIDTLCGYCNGEKTTRNLFINFIQDELYKEKSNELQTKIQINEVKKVVATDTYLEITKGKSPPITVSIAHLLYSQFRCGLVHSFSFNGQAGFYIDHSNKENAKFNFDPKKGLVIDFLYFYDKYVDYWDYFKNKLKKDSSLEQNFSRRYQTLMP